MRVSMWNVSNLIVEMPDFLENSYTQWQHNSAIPGNSSKERKEIRHKECTFYVVSIIIDTIYDFHYYS